MSKTAAIRSRKAVALKQTYAREGKTLQRKAGGYGHVKQFHRLRKGVKRQRTMLGSGHAA